jgi:hypothetical protein
MNSLSAILALSVLYSLFCLYNAIKINKIAGKDKSMFFIYFERLTPEKKRGVKKYFVYIMIATAFFLLGIFLSIFSLSS